MPGTREGAAKAVAKILEKNSNHFKEIALKSQAKWQENGRRPRGFAYDPELARTAGAKGGRTSRRGKAE